MHSNSSIGSGSGSTPAGAQVIESLRRTRHTPQGPVTVVKQLRTDGTRVYQIKSTQDLDVDALLTQAGVSTTATTTTPAPVAIKAPSKTPSLAQAAKSLGAIVQRPWSQEERDFIRDNLNRYSNQEFAELFGRTQAAVSQFINQRLKLKRTARARRRIWARAAHARREANAA